MPSSADEAVLVLTLRDQLSAQVIKTATAVERLNTATAGGDKALIKFERTFANAAANAGLFGKSMDKNAASAVAAARSMEAYQASIMATTAQERALQATLARTGTVRSADLGAGIGRSSNGRLMSSAQVAEAIGAEKGLAAAQAQRAAALTILNRLTMQQAAYLDAVAAAEGVSLRTLLTSNNVQARSIALKTAANEANNALAASTSRLSVAQAATAIRANNLSAGFKSGGPGLIEGQIAAKRVSDLGLKSVAAQSVAATRGLSGLASMSNSVRYALYDMSRAATQTGLALVALPIISGVVAAKFENDFATVRRVLVGTPNYAEKNFAALERQLISLSTTIPLTFKEITDMAAAGSQLGIDPGGLVQFTHVVAQLDATTDLTAESAENLLGKFHAITGLPQDQFAKLASAILNVGVNSAATESQIAKVSTQILGIGAQAGFSVQSIVAIAGAIQSVSSAGQDTLIRGSFTRFITQMQKGVSEGGPILQTFAKVAGVTSSQVQAAFGTEKFEPLFVKFVGGLQKVQKAGGDTTAILAEMGITGVRDIPVWNNLAMGFNVLKTSLADAAYGFEHAELLQQHYEARTNTLIAKVQILGNTFMAAMNNIGASTVGPLKDMTESLTDWLKGFGEWATTDAGGNFLVVAAGAALVAGGLFLALGALTRVVAGLQAVGTSYEGVMKVVTKFREAQAASAAASVTGLSKLQSLGAFLTGPWGIALAIAAVATIGFVHAMDEMKAKPDEIQAALAKGGASAASATTKLVQQGDAVSNAWNWMHGKGSLEDSFKNFDASIKRSANVAKEIRDTGWGGGPLDMWWNHSDVSAFNESMTTIGQNLADLANKNLPSAQAGFAGLAARTDGTEKSMSNLLKLTGPYYDLLKEQALAAGESTSAHALLVRALGAAGAGLLGAGVNAAEFARRMEQSAGFTRDLVGSIDGGQKAIDDFTESWSKSTSSLWDFNSVVQQVQQSQEDAVNATAKANKEDADQAALNEAKSVSLSAYTQKLGENNDKQQEWLSGLMKLKQQMSDNAGIGPETADKVVGQLVQAGYSAVNNSILQQLINATPAQQQEYADKTSAAMALAGAAAAQALLASGHIYMQNAKGQWQAIGQEQADSIAIGLKAGLPIEVILADMNAKFMANPPVMPPPNTVAADERLRQWRNSERTVDNVKVGTPVTTDADTFIDSWVRKDITLQNSHINPTGANADADAISSYASGKTPVMGSHIDPTGGNADADAISNYASGKVPIMGSGMDQTGGRGGADGIVGYAQGKTATLQSGVDDSGARVDLLGFVRWAGSQVVNVVANVLTGKGPGGATGGYYNGSDFKSSYGAGYYGGGFTGPGRKYQPAGLVHKGEFVFTKEATARIGVKELYALMNGQRNAKAAPRTSYADGGYVGGWSGGGAVTVELSAYDRILLNRIGNPKLIISQSDIAGAGNRAAVGANNRREN